MQCNSTHVMQDSKLVQNHACNWHIHQYILIIHVYMNSRNLFNNLNNMNLFSETNVWCLMLCRVYIYFREERPCAIGVIDCYFWEDIYLHINMDFNFFVFWRRPIQYRTAMFGNFHKSLWCIRKKNIFFNDFWSNFFYYFKNLKMIFFNSNSN